MDGSWDIFPGQFAGSSTTDLASGEEFVSLLKQGEQSIAKGQSPQEVGQSGWCVPQGPVSPGTLASSSLFPIMKEELASQFSFFFS